MRAERICCSLIVHRRGTIARSVPITGGIGDTLQAIDFRPATGQLYGLAVTNAAGTGGTGQIVVLNTQTGARTSVGSPFSVAGATSYGFDFNPTVDRIRVTTDTDVNLRINPDDGAAINDGTLAFAPGDRNFGNNPTIGGVAYINNTPNAAATQLFGIDYQRDALVTISPANDGTVISIAPLSFGVGSTLGFDVAASGKAFVSYVRDDAVFATISPPPAMTNLATLNLSNGTLTELGTINSSGAVRDIAVSPVGVSASFVAPFAVGSDLGVDSRLQVYNPARAVIQNISPFPGFTGGTRVAAADFNNDGVVDSVVGTGPGAPSRVLIFSGKDNSLLSQVNPFESSFTGGVYVTAGDVTGDGVADLVVTPDQGGGPRVRVYRGGDYVVVADFFGIEDTTFRGGARAAVGDVNSDGTEDLVVAAGFGGGPRIAAFNGTTVTQPLASGATPPKLFGDIFVFEETLRNGVFPASGDINGDGFAEVIAGGGPGGGPRVLALDGKSLLATTPVQLPVANFFAGSQDDRSGVRVTVKNLDGDTRGDIVTASGNNGTVNAYLGKNIAPTSNPPTSFFSFNPLGSDNGVFVG